jgi:hypothetical protein
MWILLTFRTASPHRSKNQNFLAMTRSEKSRLFYLSPYSPGRNHGELAWEHLKAAAAAALNHIPFPFAFAGLSRMPAFSRASKRLAATLRSFQILFSSANWPSCDTGRKSYNFPTSHHATRKTQTLTPTASNTLTAALVIRSNPPLPRS